MQIIEGREVPGYRDVVGEGPLLPQARARISPRSAALLRQFVPELADATRFPVPDEGVLWGTELPGYSPVLIDEPYGRLTGKAADQVEDEPRDDYESWEGPIAYDEQGRPLNPIGRTGIVGRLTMNAFGPTRAADAVVIRGSDILAIRRADNGQLSLPAGLLDSGENPRKGVAREVLEETGLVFDFDRAVVVYAGVVDDNRMTDNAWFETQALALAPTPAEAAQVPMSGDDAAEAKWMPVGELLAQPTHGNTAMMVRLALKHLHRAQ